jgi:hypothetical protein
MRCLWSTRTGIGATSIRAHDGGTASHCAIWLPAGTLMPDGTVLQVPHAIDAQPWHGVQANPISEWAATHRILCAYDVPLPDEAAGQASVLAKLGWGYDWWRNVGYLLWREMGRVGKVNCEELLQWGWLDGGRTFSDRHARIGVRPLREIAHACGTPVPLDALG